MCIRDRPPPRVLVSDWRSSEEVGLSELEARLDVLLLLSEDESPLLVDDGELSDERVRELSLLVSIDELVRSPSPSRVREEVRVGDELDSLVDESWVRD